MSDYKDRMLKEHSELVDRMNKLRNFLWSPAFIELAHMQQGLLIKQLAHMEAYENILATRISLG